MAQEEWAVLSDFAALPATPESRAALLAVVPLPRLLELLQAGGTRMDVLVKCLEKLLGSSEADSRQILKSDDGARMLPLGLGHPDDLVRRTSVRVAAGLVHCDEDIAWLQEQVRREEGRKGCHFACMLDAHACRYTDVTWQGRASFLDSCVRPRTRASRWLMRRAMLCLQR